MNTSAVAGDHIIVEKMKPRRLPWSMAITGTIIAVLLVAVAHLSQFGPGIDYAESVTDVGKYVCKGNNGLRRITLRAVPDTYTFRCRDGAVHEDVKVTIAEPQT